MTRMAYPIMQVYSASGTAINVYYCTKAMTTRETIIIWLQWGVANSVPYVVARVVKAAVRVSSRTVVLPFGILINTKTLWLMIQYVYVQRHPLRIIRQFVAYEAKKMELTFYLT